MRIHSQSGGSNGEVHVRGQVFGRRRQGDREGGRHRATGGRREIGRERGGPGRDVLFRVWRKRRNRHLRLPGQRVRGRDGACGQPVRRGFDVDGRPAYGGGNGRRDEEVRFVPAARQVVENALPGAGGRLEKRQRRPRELAR